MKYVLITESLKKWIEIPEGIDEKAFLKEVKKKYEAAEIQLNAKDCLGETDFSVVKAVDLFMGGYHV